MRAASLAGGPTLQAPMRGRRLLANGLMAIPLAIVCVVAACTPPPQGNPQVVPATSIVRPEIEAGGSQPTRPPLSPAVAVSPSPPAASSPLPIPSPSPSPSPAIHPVLPGFSAAPSPTSG